jgi:citrate lyase subunit beta/citryl-CoA lyase
MLNMSLIRSVLYAPGNRPELMEKSLATEADAVIFDLEDAVPPGEKQKARKNVVQFMKTAHAKPVIVRINNPQTYEGQDDLHALHGAHIAAIRIPKCESVEDVQDVGRHLWGDVALQVAIESARGLIIMEQVATAHPRIISVSLGEGDLRAQLGVSKDHEFEVARFRQLVVSHAAGLGAPMMSVYPFPRDSEGLRASTLSGKAGGFFGRTAIHPSQVRIINEIFTLSKAEVEDAREMLDAFQKKDAAGSGAFVLSDGRFVDEAVVKAARKKLELAKAFGLA